MPTSADDIGPDTGTGPDPDPAASAAHRIDVHTHYFGGSVGAFLDAGFRPAGGYRFSVQWTVEEALGFMARHGIGAQVLSVPLTPGGSAGDPHIARRFARRVNEELAELIRAHPGRFGGFAAVPGDEGPDGMLEEIEYALDTLGLDGVLLTSNVRGLYFGMAAYEPVLAELARRAVPVFVHPTDSPTIVEHLGFGRPSSVCEFPFDTARNLVNGIYQGVFLRHPSLVLILAHCGGPLPTLGWRIAEHTTMGMGPEDDAAVDPDHVAWVLRRLYYDTALAGSRHSLLPTLEVTGPDHLLFGTDWPAAPERTAVRNTDNLVTSGCFTDAELRAVTGDTARRLFPRLAARMS